MHSYTATPSSPDDESYFLYEAHINGKKTFTLLSFNGSKE